VQVAGNETAQIPGNSPGKNIEQSNKLWEWVDADFEADLHK